VLAAVAGAVIGVAIWLLGLAFHSPALAFGKLLLAGAASGLVSGVLFPHVAMELVETVAHFTFGAASALVQEVPDQSPISTPWLRMSFTFGIVYAVLLFIFL